jgi:hypothetical protein
MNSNACTTNHSLHKNTGTEKRNYYHVPAARFYKNSETGRRSIPFGNISRQDAALISIVRLFKGSIVTPEEGAVEYKCTELFL